MPFCFMMKRIILSKSCYFGLMSILKIRGLGAKLCGTFLFFLFLDELWRFKVKESMLFVEQKLHFNKNYTESKMETRTHSFREIILCFISYKNRELKVKLGWVRTWEKKRMHFFVPFILSKVNFFNICVLFQYIVYWINFSEYIYF